VYNSRQQIRNDIIDAQQHLKLAEKRIKHRIDTGDSDSNSKYYSSLDDDRHDLEKIKAVKIILDL